MVVIKVELWPGGDATRAKKLGEAHIWNKSNLAPISNYGFSIFDKAGRQFRRGDVKGFPRNRLLAWDLLFRVLRAAFGGRNKEIGEMAEVA